MIRNRSLSCAKKKSYRNMSTDSLVAYLVILLLSRKLGDPRRLGIEGDRDLVRDLDLDE